jgi:hypothetical protein
LSISVRGPRHLLEDDAGKVWSVDADAVKELAHAEASGAFDELGGNMARLEGVELLTAICSPALAEAFRPLFTSPAEKVLLSKGFSATKAELLEAGRPSPDLRVSPWVSPLRAARARDVLARQERNDDRPSWEIAATSSRALANRRAAGDRSAFNFPKTKDSTDRSVSIGSL